MKTIYSPEGFIFTYPVFLRKRLFYLARRSESKMVYFGLYDPIFEKFTGPINKVNSKFSNTAYQEITPSLNKKTNNFAFLVRGQFISEDGTKSKASRNPICLVKQVDYSYCGIGNGITIEIENYSDYCSHRNVLVYEKSMCNVRNIFPCDPICMSIALNTKIKSSFDGIVVIQPEHSMVPKFFGFDYSHDIIYIDPSEPVIVAFSFENESHLERGKKLTLIDLE